MKIIPLSEGSFTIDKSKLFVPFDEGQHELKDRPTGSLLVEVQPFLVVTEKDILLLDTGLGFSKDGVMQIHSNMNAVGIHPDQVTKVLMSHLHKDHAGGVSNELGGGIASLSFRNARYYVQESELKYAFEKGFPSYITKELEALKHSSQVIFLTDESGLIDNYIKYQVTGAHSPHHQVFWITENNETIFFGADDAPQLQQMKNRFVAKYDFNGRRAMELRQEWWIRGGEEGWEFLFYHDLKTPIHANEANQRQ